MQGSNLRKPQQGKSYNLCLPTQLNIEQHSLQFRGSFLLMKLGHTLESTHPLERLCFALLLSAGQADFHLETLSSCNFSSAPGDAVRAAPLVFLQEDKDSWEAIYMGWESCHHKTSIVTWDSEEMVAEQCSSFHPNLRPFEQLTAAFQLCVCVQHLWSLIIHLGQYSCRKSYRAWHIRVKLRCNNVLRSTSTLLDQEWI